ncbi:hypothetical protein FOXYSP1_13030 [Fusarium oxysporum f. sp. phaseoli]
MPVFPRSVPFPVYQYDGALFSVVALGTGPLRVQQETHHNTITRCVPLLWAILTRASIKDSTLSIWLNMLMRKDLQSSPASP